MLEKMFTTKMSADKKKLQSRFSKIRSKNGRLSKVIGGILFGIIIAAIICVGVMIAVNNTKDYRMTDDEFSDYIHRPIGSIMADLDYVDDEKLVFHYLEGFFVVDQQSYEIRHKINLSKLNIAGHTQGDCFTVFKIDKDGNFAYLINEGSSDLVGNYDNYIVNLTTGTIKKGNMPDGTELFANYAGTATVKDAEGWVGTGIIERDGKTYYLTVKDSVIGAIQLATVYDNVGNEVDMRYVFGDGYVSLSQQKVNIINESLSDNEEILVNSGFYWEVNDDKVKSIINKLSETRNMKYIDIKDGNYDVRLYNVWDNASEENNLRIFILDNYKFELVFYIDITLDEHKYFVNMLNNPDMPQKEFYPRDIKNITHAELMINGAVYPILVRSNLEKIEQMLTNAKIIKGATDCPIKGILVLTNQDGEKGMVTLATDSCAVFVSNSTYYDYSDGDNSEMLGYFGIDSEKILDLTT
ncbi:MAG: hypothetical protein IKB93_13370 [Clostridia bacterium]|nr:hypothetical protein [Clostridia bacterium]